jgi:hypothetical protein
MAKEEKAKLRQLAVVPEPVLIERVHKLPLDRSPHCAACLTYTHELRYLRAVRHGGNDLTQNVHR